MLVFVRECIGTRGIEAAASGDGDRCADVSDEFTVVARGGVHGGYVYCVDEAL